MLVSPALFDKFEPVRVRSPEVTAEEITGGETVNVGRAGGGVERTADPDPPYPAVKSMMAPLSTFGGRLMGRTEGSGPFGGHPIVELLSWK
jgi:hypothetical protein